MNIRITNLSRKITEEELKELFTTYGKVISVTIVKDQKTNLSKGFGFIEMETKHGAQRAISKLHKTKIKGERISVKISE